MYITALVYTGKRFLLVLCVALRLPIYWRVCYFFCVLLMNIKAATCWSRFLSVDVSLIYIKVIEMFVDKKVGWEKWLLYCLCVGIFILERLRRKLDYEIVLDNEVLYEVTLLEAWSRVWNWWKMIKSHLISSAFFGIMGIVRTFELIF